MILSVRVAHPAATLLSLIRLGRLGLAWLCLTPLGSLQLLSYLRRDFLKPAAFNRLAFCSTALFFLAIVADIFGLLVTSDPRVAL